MVLIGVTVAVTSAGSDDGLRDPARVERWRTDIRQFARDLPKEHANFFWRTGKAPFERGIDSLLARVPGAPDWAILAALTRLGAIADGHTGVQWSDSAARTTRIPLVLSRFDEGWFVVAADSARRDVLGTRVVAIGDTAIARVESVMTPYVPHDNAPSLLDFLGLTLVTPEIVAGAGLAADPAHVRYTFEDSSGSRRTLTLAGVPARERIGWVTYFAHARVPTSVARQDPAANYWFRHLADSRTLLFRYNRCAEMDTLPFAEFARRMFAFLDRTPVDRIIVDLRSNSGGASQVIAPFRDPVLARSDLARKDRLFVLIGRRTFSSGAMNAAELARKATLVGQATGGAMDSWGETRTFRLEHSGLLVRYSTKFFTMTKEYPWTARNPRTLEPDIPAPLTWADYRAGRDAALELAIVGAGSRHGE